MELYRRIEHGISKGLEGTCKDAIMFNGSFDSEVKPEYLITMNISKAISDLNYLPGSPFIIKPEESTKAFATRCVPGFKLEDIFSFIPRSLQNTERNGRLDIAIYNEDKEKPLTAIEVKLLNPRKDDIEDDVIRLSELLHLSDQSTGNSKVEHTYFACIEMSEKVKFEGQVMCHRKEVQDKYKSYLQEIFSSKTNTKFEVASLSIDDSFILTPEKVTGEEIFDGDQYSYAKHLIGVIVRLTKN